VKGFRFKVPGSRFQVASLLNYSPVTEPAEVAKAQIPGSRFQVPGSVAEILSQWLSLPKPGFQIQGHTNH